MNQVISDDYNKTQKITIVTLFSAILPLVVPLTVTGCAISGGREPLPAPANLKYYFHDDEREIKFAWDEVDGATQYEFSGGGTGGVTAENYGYISDVNEGDSGWLKVRACGEDGNVSEWAGIEYSIDIYVTAPKTLTSQVDGKYNYVIWEPVDGAARYEIRSFDEDGNEKETIKVDSPENYFRLDRKEAGNRKFDIRTVKEIGGQEYSSEWKSMTVTTVGMINPMECTYIESCTLDLDSLQEYARRHAYTCNISRNGDKSLVEIRIRDILADDMFHRLSRTTAGVMTHKSEVSQGIVEYFDILDKDVSKSSLGMPPGQAPDQRGWGPDPMRFEAYIICQYEYSDSELAPDRVRIGMMKRFHEDFQSNLEANLGKPDNGYYWVKVHDIDQKMMMSIGSNDNFWLVDIFPSHAK